MTIQSDLTSSSLNLLTVQPLGVAEAGEGQEIRPDNENAEMAKAPLREDQGKKIDLMV